VRREVLQLNRLRQVTTSIKFCEYASNDPKRAVDNCRKSHVSIAGQFAFLDKNVVRTGNITDTRLVVTSINSWNEIGTAAGNGRSLG
jgi:hypothetical protein